MFTTICQYLFSFTSKFPAFFLITFPIIMIDTKINEGIKGLVELKGAPLTIKSYYS